MARRPLHEVHTNLTAGAPLAVGSTTAYQPEYTLGHIVYCDSGVYVYGQANGTVAEGDCCKYVERAYDFDPAATGEGDTELITLGVCVTSGGLADNQHGWFWLGEGSEYVLCEDVAADVQVTLTAAAGTVGAGGEAIDGLVTIENNASAGLTLCRSATRLTTNPLGV